MSSGPKEITPKASKINVLAAKTAGKEITPSQGTLPLGIEKTRDFGEIGMGVLSDGTPYLSQRGLAVLSHLMRRAVLVAKADTIAEILPAEAL